MTGEVRRFAVADGARTPEQPGTTLKGEWIAFGIDDSGLDTAVAEAVQNRNSAIKHEKGRYRV
jgi:hypothetical protein